MTHILPYSGTRANYSVFRATIVAALAPKLAARRPSRYLEFDDVAADNSRLAIGRKQITAFQEYVADHLDRLLKEDPEQEPLIRRALGIPDDISLQLSGWANALEICRLIFLPTMRNLNTGAVQLRRIRTFQGRQHVFTQVLKIRFQNNRYFHDSDDFILRRLHGFRDIAHYDDVARLPYPLLRAAYRLGVRNPDDMLKRLAPIRSGFSPDILELLVAEHVLSEPNDFSRLTEYVRRDHYPHHDPDLEQLRFTLRLLMQAGIPAQQVLCTLKWPYHCNPQHLTSTLDLLRNYGVSDVASLYDQVGPLLWTGELAHWRFVFDEIGARNAEDVGRFKKILNSSDTPSPALVRQLRQLGAGLDELALCEDLIVRTAGKKTAPIDQITLLTQAPYSLTVTQLASCVYYLKERDTEFLGAYLQVLHAYGYSDPHAILAFQPCYTRIYPTTLGNLLDIIRQQKLDNSVEDIAQWITAFDKRDSYLRSGIFSLQYLASAIDLPDLDQLTKVFSLCDLSPTLLQYLIERKKLTSLKDLRKWQNRFGKDAQKYRGGGRDHEIDYILFDDASDRQNFAFIERNYRCIADAIRDAAWAKAGKRPSWEDRPAFDAYNANCMAIEAKLEEQIKPDLPQTLLATDGMLLRSILNALIDQDVERQRCLLAELGPIVDDLLLGAGPSHTELSALEADAISLIYGVDPHFIAHHWKSVGGCEHHLNKLHLHPTYPMIWRRMVKISQESVSQRELDALRDATLFAKRFHPDVFHDMFEACKHLRPGQLSEPSAEPRSLRHHLGVLLAAGESDTHVAEWTRERLSNLNTLQDCGSNTYQLLQDLDAFFSTTLADGLANSMEGFVARFPENQAARLAARLGAPRQSDNGQPIEGRASLCHALKKTCEKVTAVYRRWVDDELKKFSETTAPGARESQLSAVVSKHPAAFFAKEATKLCTAGNVPMWREDHHAHLLVFDHSRKRLVGMAMLYVMPLSFLSKEKKSLIVRAINPTEEALAEYDASSIVDAYVNVCRQIAETNDLACVAFPDHAGMGFLSNRTAIEKDITARFIKSALTTRVQKENIVSSSMLGLSPYYTSQSDAQRFYAYEHGQGEINTFYFVWQSCALTHKLRLHITENQALTG